VGKGKHTAELASLYGELRPMRRRRIEAVSLDMGGAHKKATEEQLAHTRHCADPFRS
jgi:hypothetical protein